MGGNEKNLKPGLEFFGKLAKAGRLSLSNPVIASLEKGEVQVGVVWDFNGLNYRDQIDKTRFEVLIPSDGSITSGYTTIINKYAKHRTPPSWRANTSSPTLVRSTWRAAMPARSAPNI